jgi:NADH-quinone oxidoreductase subunit L
MERCLDIIPWAILLMPLVGFVTLSLFGEWIKRDKEDDGATVTSCALVLVSFGFAVVQAYCVAQLGRGLESLREELLTNYRLATGVPYLPYQPSFKDAIPLSLFGIPLELPFSSNWISVAGLRIPFGLLLDPLSCVMTLVVTGVGSLIHIYSLGYMAKDPERVRFFSYLNLFTFFMLLLVLGGSLPLMFVGWEGVGLCSYLLIGFWFKKKSASDAGKKAFIVNRIGDVGIILGTIVAFQRLGQLNLFDLARAASSYPVEHFGQFGTVTLVCLLLFVGACGKSAQIPLHVWLPDAMEGPTPVSALIHAATMVTAGVYMVARLGPLFSRSETATIVVAVVGTLTAFMGAAIALVQTDIKKVLAYSTVSQLGYMFLACGVGAYDFGVFHLFTHAFFKALLFLGAGSVIHAMSGEQDMRQMGGLRQRIPWTFWTFTLGTLSIAGIPFLAGFWSKDAILESALESGHTLLFGVGMVTALLTAFYMGRLLVLTFFGPFRGSHEVEHHIHESPWSMLVPLVLLGVGAVAAGYVPVPAIIETSLRMHPREHASSILPFVATVVALLGLGAAWWLYAGPKVVLERLSAPLGGVRRILEAKWGFDLLYDWFADTVVVGGSRVLLWKFFDASLIDGIVNGAGEVVAFVARLLRPLQTGFVRSYALMILFGAVLVVGYVLFVPS